MNWGEFEVGTTVVHYVPTSKDEPEPELLLTKAPIDLDHDLRTYFSTKVTDRLRKKGLEIVEDAEEIQTVPDAMAQILADDALLVERSKGVAEHLFEIQGGNNSSGLLALMTGKVDGEQAVAVVKLERQRGVSFEIDPQTGTVDLELLRNLTLTDKTKVYKTALFVAGGTSQKVLGLAADDQRTSATGRQVADFFLGRFLGCKPRLPAAQLTYKFVVAANEAINVDVPDRQRRGDYQVALISELKSNASDINPKRFAQNHLRAADRPTFLKRVEEAGIDPERDFPKDTTRIHVEKFRVTFSSGMMLIGPPDALEENVEIPESPSAQDPVQLKDRVDSIIIAR